MDIDLAAFQATAPAINPRAIAATNSNDVNRARVRQAAEEFESVFLAEMLKPMFAEIDKGDGMFDGGSGEEIYRSMMVQEYGKALSKSGGFGIADAVEREMLKIQEGAAR